MNAEFTSQLPDPLNRIELGTIRRQEIQAQFAPVIPQPGLQESGMMISGVIQNDHHLLVGGTMAKEVFQEFTKGLPVEFVPLLCYQSAFPQTDGSKHPDLFVCRSMPEDRIFDFDRNPHHISRSVLLKMTLIQTPKVKVISSHEPMNFFYMPLGPPDWLLRLSPEACVVEIPDGERGVDIVVPPSLSQTPALNGGTTRRHPTVLEYIPRRWEAFVNQPLTVSAGEDSKKSAVLSPQHLSVPSSLPPGIDGTNTGWFEGNVPIDFRLHRCSFLDKGRAIHEADGHIGIPEILRFPVVKPILRPWDHQISAFPWLPPFWVTMVTQNLFMRN
jgi:hypothetical protein